MAKKATPKKATPAQKRARHEKAVATVEAAAKAHKEAVKSVNVLQLHLTKVDKHLSQIASEYWCD